MELELFWNKLVSQVDLEVNNDNIIDTLELIEDHIDGRDMIMAMWSDGNDEYIVEVTKFDDNMVDIIVGEMLDF